MSEFTADMARLHQVLHGWSEFGCGPQAVSEVKGLAAQIVRDHGGIVAISNTTLRRLRGEPEEEVRRG